MEQRLIDANMIHDHLFAVFDTLESHGEMPSKELTLMCIDNAEMVDPVRHERWEPYKCGKYRCTGKGCETLANQYQRKLWRFCPGCGARMDADKK